MANAPKVKRKKAKVTDDLRSIVQLFPAAQVSEDGMRVLVNNAVGQSQEEAIFLS